MNKIVSAGLDVHKNTISICAVEAQYGCSQDLILFQKQIPTRKGELLKAFRELQHLAGPDTEIRAAYEAGCLGMVPYYWLEGSGYKCVIMAPTTMENTKVRKVKTDSRDAYQIAHLLAHGGFQAIHIPDETDRQIRDYIRMRDQARSDLKIQKQQLQAFALKLGFYPNHTSFSKVWFKELREWLEELDSIDQETMTEYLLEYDHKKDRLERIDRKIDEFASLERYRQKAGELACLTGISIYTAMVLISEIGDFSRFKTPDQLASYLGLTPGEDSSGDKRHRTGITKNGNGHVRKTLTEASQSICRGAVGYKSSGLKKRQQGQRPEVIEYADKGSRYLRKRYYRLIQAGKNRNTAVTAVARSLVGFIWGIMTDHIEINRAAA